MKPGAFFLVTVVMLAGCSATGLDLGEPAPTNPRDAGSLDASRMRDAARPDARTGDAGGAMDSAVRDAQLSDANDDARVDAGCEAFLDRDPFACPLQRTRVATDPADWMDAFGTTVAIDGDTLVVGAPGDDSAALGINGDRVDNNATDSGAVHVFVRRGQEWIRQAYLKADELTQGLGSFVAIHGDTLVATAGGFWSPDVVIRPRAFVFTRAEGHWRQTALIARTDQWNGGPAPVGLTSNTLVLGEDGTSSGVDVYVRDGESWREQAQLQPNEPGGPAGFGRSVAIAGDTVVVGSPLDMSNALGVDGDASDRGVPYNGAAYVFVRRGSTWTQQAYLKQGELTGVCFRCDRFDYFGSSVSITGETVVIGAPGEKSNAVGINGTQTASAPTAIGAVYVFTRAGDTWAQQAHVRPTTVRDSNDGDLHGFGAGVAAFDNAFVVGAEYAGPAHGLWLFVRTTEGWIERGILDRADPRPIGARVAMSRDTIAVGAPEEEGTDIDAFGAGAAYVFRYEP